MSTSRAVQSDPYKRPPISVGEGQKPSARALLSDDATLQLVVLARTGDCLALEALLERCLPPLRRWAHRKLPAAARGRFDTSDLVQDAALHLLQRLDVFEPLHVGALQAYLRQSVTNRIRDEVRRVSRQPPAVELPDDQPSDHSSPLEAAIRAESCERYRRALSQLAAKDRELIVARIEMQWSLSEVAHRFRLRTVDAARMAVTRAVKHLTRALHSST